MSSASKIEWTEQTWNPFAGCAILSPGCTNCYAMKMAARLDAMGQPLYKGLTKPSKAGPVWRGTVRANPDALLAPLKRKKPTTYFVNSMSDLFYEKFDDDLIDRVFAVMALTPQHTYQVLTKRAERMREYMRAYRGFKWLGYMNEFQPPKPGHGGLLSTRGGALRNVWLGVSTERQTEADERIPHLLQTPAAVRFISAEPLLGPIDLTPYVQRRRVIDAAGSLDDDPRQRLLDWVIVGGESGPGARPMHPQWARDLRDQCAAAGVPFFFKQHGEWLSGTQYTDVHRERDPDAEQSRFACMDWDGQRYVESGSMWCDDLDEHAVYRVGKKAAGRLLDGIEHNAMPGA